MTTKRALSCLALLTTTSTGCGHASAATFDSWTFGEKVSNSAAGFVGHLDAVNIQLEGGIPVQTLTFKDVEWAFGGSGTTHVVRMAGGTVGDVSVRASGLPVFESGHRYALLLAQGGDLAMPFTQGENGAWQVVISGFGDELLVSSPGEVLLETATGGVRAARWFPNASSAAEMSALAPDFERSLTVRRWLSLVSGRAQVTVMPSVPSVEGNISVEGGQ